MRMRSRVRDVETKTRTLYNWVIVSLFYTVAVIIVRGDDEPDVTPLAGSKQRFPRIRGYADEAGDLARLLDVGSCMNTTDRSISYVPPLDGTVALPGYTRCLDMYGMNFVLFDFQLVNLKDVDSLNGFFTVELQLVLYWEDFIEKSGAGSYVDPNNKNCSFLCDTSSPSSLCCDDIWVPPLRIPGCQLNDVQSIMDHPYLYSSQNKSVTNMTGCEQQEFSCVWRRLWYLNIDAQCAVDMNFHDFPFDFQTLTLDILNPYSSRTWFQLTQGFLQRNVDDRISGVNLSPDKKISGWYIRDLIVSRSCGSVQTWQNTFITQDDLLAELSVNEQYKSQKENITQALDPEKLQCANIENLMVGNDDATLANPANWDSYDTTQLNYLKRVQDTLQAYHKCVHDSGVYYNLNLTKGPSLPLPHLDNVNFSISEDNLNRSFGLFNLFKEQPKKLSFECAIEAVGNLTTPGIRITILIKRVRTVDTCQQRQRRDVPQSATNMRTNSLKIQFHPHPKTQQEVELSSSNQHQENSTQEESSYQISEADSANNNMDQSCFNYIQNQDFKLLVVLALAYISSIIGCLVLPYVRAQHLKNKDTQGISMWNRYTK